MSGFCAANCFLSNTFPYSYFLSQRKSQKPHHYLDHAYPPNPEMSDAHTSTRQNVTKSESWLSSIMDGVRSYLRALTYVYPLVMLILPPSPNGHINFLFPIGKVTKQSSDPSLSWICPVSGVWVTTDFGGGWVLIIPVDFLAFIRRWFRVWRSGISHDRSNLGHGHQQGSS